MGVLLGADQAQLVTVQGAAEAHGFADELDADAVVPLFGGQVEEGDVGLVRLLAPAGVQLEQARPVAARHGDDQALGVGLPGVIGIVQEARAVIAV